MSQSVASKLLWSPIQL